MKKFLTLALTAVMALSLLTACGSKNDNSADTNTDGSNTETTLSGTVSTDAGNSSTRCSGAGIRTRCRSWMAASRASLVFIPRWSIRDSPICLPMLCTGLSAVIGSWKMTPIWRPRMPCMSVYFA